MEQYKRDFIEFMVRTEVLCFGDFTAKSGRKTPYFINAGRYRTGGQMQRLASFYADAILAQGLQFDFLFGPAYKGIPLAVATAMALSARGQDVPFCFNRKEIKDHGEGGSLVGHLPKNGERALIIEDVTTAGTSVRETVPLLQAAASEVSIAGLVVAVDRMERGTGDRSALAQLRAEYSMVAFSIVTVDEILEHLRSTPLDGKLVLTEELYAQVLSYRQEYGAP